MYSKKIKDEELEQISGGCQNLAATKKMCLNHNCSKFFVPVATDSDYCSACGEKLSNSYSMAG